MEKLFIYIKHHLSILWKFIEWINGMLFSLFYSSKLAIISQRVIKDFSHSPFSFRRLTIANIIPLHNLIVSQPESDLEYFLPHGFDFKSLTNQFKNPSFLMMGTFYNDEIVGYFFLRFFVNRKCFVGRLIDHKYRGKGIGLIMNSIMYENAWQMGFRCLSTISRDNRLVMQAHSKNSAMKVLKKLPNNYLLVEFVRE